MSTVFVVDHLVQRPFDVLALPPENAAASFASEKPLVLEHPVPSLLLQ